jgi:8-oxo-dGTP pyrophosphatase MutT (NUDIX family)
MKVRYCPETTEGAEKWQSTLRSVELSQEEIGAQIADLFLDEAPQDVSLRLLSPGKSGAVVAVASFIDKNRRQCDWVIKLVPRKLLHLLQQELGATNKYAKVLFPDLEIRRSIACIATNFAKVSDDLGSYLAKACTRQDVACIIDSVFESLASWYASAKPTTQGFFDLHRLTFEVQNKLEEINQSDLLDMWHRLSGLWPIAKGVITTIAHGDLNQSNILLRTDDTPALIDYALTGEKHWALDFARLERQVKFVLAPIFPEGMSVITDSAFDFRIPTEENAQTRILTAVAAIRRQAHKYFKRAVGDFSGGYHSPDFAQEYFHALIFQQMCLIGSSNWSKSPEQYAQIADSTRRVLGSLLIKQPQEFFFGYFSCVVEGKERVLLRKDRYGRWFFPICGFVPRHSGSVKVAVDHAVSEFVNLNDARRSNFLSSGFSPIELHRLITIDPEKCRIEWDNQERFVSPYFFRIRVNKEFDVMNSSYFWASKGASFDGVKYEGATLECGQPALKVIVCSDFVRQEYGRRILECCDIIVFREKSASEDECEFLMLRRHDNGGWEYPKGGIEYHETPHEGAVRELLEETGIGHISDFISGGELGFQTADVGWREKAEYDALRVCGVTYFFAGKEEDIRVSVEHGEFRWMSLQEAQEKQWIGPYGNIFFDRWKQMQLRIRQHISRPVSIAFQVTEKCSVGCRFCLRRKDDEEVMSSNRMEELIDILKERAVKRLTFTGG